MTKMTKKKYIALKRIVALITALMLVMVPMVAHGSEGETFVGFDSGYYEVYGEPELPPEQETPAFPDEGYVGEENVNGSVEDAVDGIDDIPEDEGGYAPDELVTGDYEVYALAEGELDYGEYVGIQALDACIECDPCLGCGECTECSKCLPFRFRTFGGDGYGADFHLGNYQFGEIHTFPQLRYYNLNPPSGDPPRYDWWGAPIITGISSATIVSTSGTNFTGNDAFELGLITHGGGDTFGQINLRFGHNLPGIPAEYRYSNSIHAFPWVSITLFVDTLCGPQEITIINHFNPCTNCNFDTCCDYCQFLVHDFCIHCGECRICSDCLVFSWDIFNNGPCGNPVGTPNESLAEAGIIRMWTQVNEVDARMPFLHDGGTVTAVFRGTDDCAMEFVSIGQIYIAGTGFINYFNHIDVIKDDAWEFIYLTIVPFECHPPLTVLLHNGNFVPPGHTVTFIVNNGPVGIYAPYTRRITVDDGGPFPTDYIPQFEARRGWEFVGWEPYDPIGRDGTNVTYSMTFEAMFEELWWRFTFIVEEGGVAEGEEYHRERDGWRLPSNHGLPGPVPIEIPSTEARPGYRFVGWYQIYPGDERRIGEDWSCYECPVYNYTLDFRGNRTFVARFERIVPDITKTVSPATVQPGGTVTYTITIDTGGMCREAFRDVIVFDPLHVLLTLNVGSIAITGVEEGWYCYSDDSQLRIVEMELSDCPEDGYFNTVVITFTVTVCPDAPPGVIENIAELWWGEDYPVVGRASLGVGPREPGRYGRISVNKVWEDDNNAHGLRPPSIQVELRRVGSPTPHGTAVLNAPYWRASWSYLPLEGAAWYVNEINVPLGYVSSVFPSGAVTFPATGGNRHFTITNTLVVKDIEVIKLWECEDCEPHETEVEYIYVQLRADGVPVGDPVRLEGTDWSHLFEGLPVYNATGVRIVYIVEEVDVPDGYESSGGVVEYVPGEDGEPGSWKAIIVNTYEGECAYTIYPELKDLEVIKRWVCEDGELHETAVAYIYVQLFANGEPVGDPVRLVGPDWNHLFEDLPVYNDEGEEITYTVEEVNVPDGYEASGGYELVYVEGDEPGFWQVTITNTAEGAYTVYPELKEIEVIKRWVCEDGEPHVTEVEYIYVQLLEDGEPVGDPVRLEGPDWSHLFEGLPIYNTEGEEIPYTVEEVDVPEGYEASGGDELVYVPGEDGEPGLWQLIITNTYEGEEDYGFPIEVKDIQVTKRWVGDTPANRPGSIQVELLVGGAPTNPPTIITITPDANGIWVGVFRDLLVYDANGNAIAYTIREINVPANYIPSVGQLNPPAGDSNVWTITLTNTLRPVPPPDSPQDPPPETQPEETPRPRPPARVNPQTSDNTGLSLGFLGLLITAFGFILSLMALFAFFLVDKKETKLVNVKVAQRSSRPSWDNRRSEDDRPPPRVSKTQVIRPYSMRAQE